jgi:glycosyltransferase involved in cell wall biosynthesis
MKTGVLIPCYNEAANIDTVVKGCMDYVSEIIVVDDGSSDGTGSIASKNGAYVINHYKNKGKGESLKTGFKHIEEKTDWDAVIILDGDGQHDWHEIPDFVKTAEKENVSIVVGDRIGVKKPKNMPMVRWLTNKFTSYITSKVIGQYVSDSQCGYKLIKTDVLKGMELRTSRYDIESEILIQASRKGAKIVSVPVKSIYRDEVSYIHPFRDSVRFVKLIYSLGILKRQSLTTVRD